MFCGLWRCWHFSESLYCSSPLPSPLLLRLENDAKVLPLHATWRMRNIYLCQLSLIAVQCQLRCQFTFTPPPLFNISPPLSLQCSLTFHFRPALSSISARYGVRFPLCASANAQPTDAEIDSLSNLSACPSVCLSFCLPVFLPAICPSLHQSAWCCLPGVSIWIVASSWPSKWKFSLSTLATKLTPLLLPAPPCSVQRVTCAKTLPASLSDFLRWHWTHLRASLLLSSVSSVSVRLSVCIDVCLRVRHLLLAFQFATFNSIYFQFINCLQHELASLLCCIPNKVFHCVLGF